MDDQSIVSHDGRTESYVVHRPVYSLSRFDERYADQPTAPRTKAQLARTVASKAKDCCTGANILSRLSRFLPFYAILRSRYKPTDIPWDLLAGFTNAIFQIPQSMAYALLAEMKPVYGLYTSFYPAILYFFFGTSMHVSVGTFSLISLMMGDIARSIVADLPSGDALNSTTTVAPLMLSTATPSVDVDDVKTQVVLCCSFLVGIIQLGMGLFQLGFLSSYLSDAMVAGFTTGASIHIMLTQFPAILGYSVKRFSGPAKLIFSLIEICKSIPQTNYVTLIISVVSVLILILVKEYLNPYVKKKIKAPLPIELIVVVGALLVSKFGKMNEKFGVKVVGIIPTGVPPPQFPSMSYIPSIYMQAIPIAIVGFASTASLVKIFCLKFNYEADYNQELNALGIGNVVGSCFSSFASAGALARTAVVVDVGMRSQITGLVSAAIILGVIYVAGPWFESLPKCVLSAVIIVALKSLLMQFTQLKRLWQISIYDFLIWVITFLATVLLDVSYGLAIGFVFSLITIVMRTQRPKTSILGRVPNTDIYKDVKAYRQSCTVPGVKIFRFDGAIYFSNADHFKNTLYRKTGLNPDDLIKKMPTYDSTNANNLPPELEDNNGGPDCLLDGIKFDNPTIVVELQDPVSPRVLERSNSFPVPINPNFLGVTTQRRLSKSTKDMSQQESEEANVTNQENNNGLNTLRLSGISSMASISHHQQARSIPCHHIILDCASWAYIDSMGIRILKEIMTMYKKCNITVFLAGCKANIRRMFVRTQLYDDFTGEFVFLTIHDAVLASLTNHEDMKREILEDVSIFEFGSEPTDIPRPSTDTALNIRATADTAVANTT